MLHLGLPPSVQFKKCFSANVVLALSVLERQEEGLAWPLALRSSPEELKQSQ